jgi:uncharacterized membrane protein YfcA
MNLSDVALTVLIFIVAVLYSSVGHAGASGYMASMALFDVSDTIMRPTQLLLNIFVSIVASYKFWGAGHFSWRLFWPFAVTSIPAALLGGTIKLPPEYFRPLIALVLLYSAWRMAIFKTPEVARKAQPRIGLCLAIGAALGFLSGLVGVGGGIFLSPMLLMLGWAGIRETAATSAMFILVNSIAGVAGVLWGGKVAVPPLFAYWIPLVVVGGYFGSHLGSKKLNTLALRRLLSIVLLVAAANEGIKLLNPKPPKPATTITRPLGADAKVTPEAK